LEVGQWPLAGRLTDTYRTNKERNVFDGHVGQAKAWSDASQEHQGSTGGNNAGALAFSTWMFRFKLVVSAQ